MIKTKFYFTFFMLYALPFCIKAQNIDTDVKQLQSEIVTLSEEVSKLKKSQKEIQASTNKLQAIQKNHLTRILLLEKENNNLQKTIDSVKTNCSTLSKTQREDKEQLTAQIGYTKEEIKINQDLLSNRTIIGFILSILILTIIIVAVFVFLKKLKKEGNSIDEVRKAQDALQIAQIKMQEESIKLDNKLLALIEEQTKNKIIDHQLALKVADEIVHIEHNLSRMDPSIKGYKHIKLGIERIKYNFLANGYEIVDMLGKSYNEGMRIVADFIVDESLPKGAQIIKYIIKPQVNYEGVMIQKAEVTVSQNI